VAEDNIINYNEDEDLVLLPSFLSSIFVYQLEAIRFLVFIGLNLLGSFFKSDEPMTLTARIPVKIDQKSSQEKKQNNTIQEF